MRSDPGDEERGETQDRVLETLVQCSDLAAVLCDGELRIQGFTPEASRLLGLDAKARGEPMTELSSELIDETLCADARGVVESGRPTSAPIILNGASRVFDRRLHPCLAEEKPEGVIVTFVDVTELAEMVQARSRELKASQNELRELTARLLDLQELTQREISRQLHNVFGQDLAVLAMRLGALTQSGHEISGELKELTDAVRQEIERLSRELHELSRELHPSLLDDFGLAAALRELTRHYSKRHGIDILLRTNPRSASKFSKAIELCFYRVAQECLANVANHARAQNVELRLGVRKGFAVLRVEDDGTGFDVDKVDLHRSLGLVGMQERVRRLDGRFSMKSVKGDGTVVEVQIPLEVEKPWGDRAS